MKCPCCKVAELEERIEYQDGTIKIRWLECANCHQEFDDEDAVEDMVDEIEWELNQKHAEDIYP